MPVSKNRRRKRKTGKAHPANAKQRRPADMQPATEADIEARLSAVLKQALPFIAPGSVQHQRRFSIRLGHNDLKDRRKRRSDRSRQTGYSSHFRRPAPSGSCGGAN